MKNSQPGILAKLPPLARYVTFDLKSPQAAPAALDALRKIADGDRCVVGIGAPLLDALGARIAGMRPFPARTAGEIKVPAIPAALWCWLRGRDRGELFHASRELEHAAAPALAVHVAVDAFRYDGGRDLSGYEDGTENPKGRKAAAAALVSGQGAGLDGSSFVAVQQWLHDFARFDAMGAKERDDAIGRRRRDNVELAGAPPSAHVKRTAQESFTPEAFLFRRSMPWAHAMRGGLMFVAFGHSFDAFEAQLKRMVGEEDSIADALFGFTQPVTGAYFWCPPVARGRLDLRAVLKK